MSVKRKMVCGIIESQEIFVGLEDSKSTWKICVRSGKQIIVDKVSMEAKYEVLKAYFDRHFPSCKINVVYESGFRGFNLYHALTAAGHNCIVTPAHTVQQEKCASVKNDYADARLLAKNLEDGNCKACHVPDKERLADRQVARTLDAVNKNVKRAKNQTRSFLYLHGIDPGIKAVTWSKCHYRSLRQLELGSQMLRKMLDMYLDQLEFFWGQQEELRKILRYELPQKERYADTVKIAQTFPGIGWLTAIRLVLELGADLSRFRSGSEIASFVGLGGTEYSTGETERRGGINKQGNSMVRAWLVECAWMAIKKDPALMQFYLRVRHNSGSCKKAIVAVARKIITRLRSCAISNTGYVIGVSQ